MRKGKVIPLKPVLQLVPPKADQSTIDTLAELLAEARAGKIVGLAFVVLRPGTDWEAGFRGECSDHPLFTIGILEKLKSHLLK